MGVADRGRAPCTAHRCAPAADPVPPLRLRRLPALRRGARPRRNRAQSLPAGRGRTDRGTRGPARPAGAAARPGLRDGGAAARRLDRRAGLHRLRALPAALPDRRDHRRTQAHAHRDRRGLQRLRALRAGLPGRLHPHGPGARPAGRAPARAMRSRSARCISAGSTMRRSRGWRATMPASGRRKPQPRERGGGHAAAQPRRGPPAVRAPPCRESQSPHTELAYASPYQLLVSVILSAQATDKSVNLATGPLFRSPARRRRLSRSARPGLPATSARSACGA